jgi:hypothetical protein
MAMRSIFLLAIVNALLPLAHSQSIAISLATTTTSDRHLASSHAALDFQAAVALQSHQLSHIAMKHYQRQLQSSTTNTAQALDDLCLHLQEQFYHDVQCDCVGALASATLSYTCRYLTPLCSTVGPKVCGQPQFAATLVDGQLFSASSCVANYTNAQRELVSYEDTCIAIEVCGDTSMLTESNEATKDSNNHLLCGCQATYGSHVCQSCTICDDSSSLSLDCTNVNAQAVSQACRPVDTDWDLAGGAGILAGFLPQFDGLCTALEYDDRVACTCPNAGGGTFNVTCNTLVPVCQGEQCGMMESTVRMEEGHMVETTGCVDYASPHDWKRVCTTVTLCDDESTICGCQALYNNQACTSCDVCDGRQAVQLNCTNIDPWAYTQECQAVTRASVFEFLPVFVSPSMKSGSVRVAVGLLQSMVLAVGLLLW